MAGLKIYMTTALTEFDGKHGCFISLAEPLRKNQAEFYFSHYVFFGYVEKDELAALGFPPPGEIRVIEVGECEEGE